MITSTEILFRVVLFELLALLLLGLALFCRRFSGQPVERIRITQFGYFAVFAAFVLVATSIVPGLFHLSLPEAPAVDRDPVAENLEESSIDPVFLSDAAPRPVTDRIELLQAEPITIPPVASYQPASEKISEDPFVPETEPPETAAKSLVSDENERQSSSWPRLLCAILLGPPCLLFLRDATAWLKLRRILARSQSAPVFVWECFREIQGDSAMRVRIRTTTEIDTPFVFGLFRPVLLLPQSLCDSAEGDNRRLRAGLAHEWLHLRRGDLLTWNIVRWFQYPLWLQPFHWMLRTRLLADQDYLADDEGARLLADRSDYAQILFEMARNRISSLRCGVLGMAGRKSGLKHRIEMLFSGGRNMLQKPRLRKILFPALVLAAITLLGATVRFGEETVASTDPPTMQALSITRENGLFEVKGILYDGGCKPVPDASILLYKEKNSGPSEIVDEETPVRTASDGSFRVTAQKMFCILAVSKDKRDFFLHMIPGDPGKADPEERSPVAQLKRGEKLTGDVVDGNGKPVEGATVGYYAQHRIGGFGRSDKSGKFDLYYPQGPELISLFAMKSKAGFDYKSFRPEIDEEAKQTERPLIDFSQPFTLALTGARDVRIKAQWNDGTSAPGITIAPWLLRNPDQGVGLDIRQFNFAFLQYFERKTTDKDGIVQFDWIPDWAEKMDLFYADFPWWTPSIPWKRLDLDFRSGKTETILVLHRAFKASGTVRYPDGKPAEGITVKYNGVNLERDYKRRDAKTDANGRYEIEIEPEAACVLSVVNDDWGALPYNPLVVNSKTRPDELQNLDFTLRKTVPVRGNVVFGPEKKHLTGLKIGFSVMGKTDLGLPPEKQLTPVEGRPRRGDEEGSGGPDLNYSLGFGRVSIDESGNWSKRLGPGEYSIHIHENTIGRTGHIRNLLPDDTKLVVPEDAGGEIVLNLNAEASGNGRLSGQVLLADGTPATGATLVGAFHSNGRSINSTTPDFSAKTDAEGRFDAPRTLEPMWLSLKSGDGSQQALLSLDEKIEAFEEPVRLRPLGSVTGRVVDMRGNAVSNLDIFYGTPVYGLFGNDDWHDKRQGFPPRIISTLRFGGTVKADADGRFRIDSIIPDSDCYIGYRAAMKEQRYGNDTFQLAKVRLERPGENRDLGDCRINPMSLEGWIAPEPDKMPKFTVRLLDDITGKPVARQRVEIGWVRKQSEKDGTKETVSVAPSRTPPGKISLFSEQNLNTNEDGKVEFTLPEQAVTDDPAEIRLQIVCFHARWYRSVQKTWVLPAYRTVHTIIDGPFTENRDFTFRSIPYSVVRGKILDPDGNPVAGVPVHLNETVLKHDGSKQSPKGAETITDAEGVFQTIIDPDFVRGSIECNAPGFMPCRFEFDKLDPGKIEQWTFTVRRGIDVAGQVVDPEGKGIAGVWVNFKRRWNDGEMRATDFSGGSFFGRSVKSGSDGFFVAPSLEREKYLVKVTDKPCCLNAENEETGKEGQPPPIFDRLIFPVLEYDLRSNDGEERNKPGPLEIAGRPTIALNYVMTDETKDCFALIYSDFYFLGRFSDTNDHWFVPTDPQRGMDDRSRATGTVHVPKGNPVTFYGSLVDEHLYKSEGGMAMHRIKPDWSLEYRFGPEGRWITCTADSRANDDPLSLYLQADPGVIEEENQTLELRIRDRKTPIEDKSESTE